MSATALGIPLALFTTSAFNAGLILEKRALDKMATLNIRKVPAVIASLIRNRAWLAGFALMLTGLACQVIVLTFEPISLVQPILASGLALSLVLSRLVLREKMGGAETWCVAAMIVSLILLALSQQATPASSARSTGTLSVVAVIIPSIAAGLLIASRPMSRRLGRHRAAATGICAGIGTGLLYGVASLTTKGLSGVVSGSHTITGLVAGIALSPYLYLFGACSAAAMLLYQAALQASRASILIPVTNVMSGLYFVIVGTWLFHEHLPSSPAKLTLRLAGIATAGLVLVLLSRQASPSPRARAQRARAQRARQQQAEQQAGQQWAEQQWAGQQGGPQWVEPQRAEQARHHRADPQQAERQDGQQWAEPQRVQHQWAGQERVEQQGIRPDARGAGAHIRPDQLGPVGAPGTPWPYPPPALSEDGAPARR